MNIDGIINLVQEALNNWLVYQCVYKILHDIESTFCWLAFFGIFYFAIKKIEYIVKFTFDEPPQK